MRHASSAMSIQDQDVRVQDESAYYARVMMLLDSILRSHFEMTDNVVRHCSKIVFGNKDNEDAIGSMPKNARGLLPLREISPSKTTDLFNSFRITTSLLVKDCIVDAP